MTATDPRTELLARLEELQLWFSRKPYGWRETAAPGMLQQWADRERECGYILARLEWLG
jgi:hypothetical protein